MNDERQESRQAGEAEWHPLALVTESELDGNCRGWDGKTMFRLANGQEWQQNSWRCRTLQLSCPAIRVWRLGTRFLLEVEGTNEILPVRRVV